MKNLLMSIFLLQTVLLLANDSLRIVQYPVSFGHSKATQRTVDAVIIHSTFNNSGGALYDIDKIVAQFARYGVSSHYVVDREGVVYQLVALHNVAYHAGRSVLPNGASNVNSRSIGIELMTSFDDAPTEAQIGTVVDLLKHIRQQYDFKYLLRHSDIAPGRKTDPWNMDWKDFVLRCETVGLCNLVTSF